MADTLTLPRMEQRILEKFRGNKIKSLAFPYPFKAWLALSNDPDSTTIDRFHQIDHFIWKELRLPFGDAVFFRSFNQNLKDQGIDTGDIIFQQPVQVAPDADPFQVRTENTLAILTHYPLVMKNVLEGQYSRKQQTSSPTPAFTSGDLTLQKKIELYNQLGVY